ncbi:MAG: metallophosphoesterase [Robiginitalea sp.]
MKKWLLYLFLIGTLLSCRQELLPPDFEHEIKSGAKPWTSEAFETTEDDFTFAIISDLNGGERPGIYSQAVTQLNRLDPTFVLSVGDLIDGGTEDTLQLRKEWDSFDARTLKLNMPFFYLGGNHDLTNIAMRDFWKNRYGPRYYHFKYKDVLFLMMDSEDFTEKRMMEIYKARDTAIRILDGELEGNYQETTYYHMPERRVGNLGKEQIAYFQKVLKENPEVRWTFVLMHKPLWMREGTGNLAPLEEALKGRNYTVINGHFHTYSHRKRNSMDYLILGTTGGSQNPEDPNSFDHITLVHMAEKPEITHLKMQGVLDITGRSGGPVP